MITKEIVIISTLGSILGNSKYRSQDIAFIFYVSLIKTMTNNQLQKHHKNI